MGVLKRPAGAGGGIQKKPAKATWTDNLQERLSQIDDQDQEALEALDKELKETITGAQRHTNIKRQP